jgi:hypothetical protein
MGPVTGGAVLGISRRTACHRVAHELRIAWNGVGGKHEEAGTLGARVGNEDARDRQNDHEGRRQDQPRRKPQPPLPLAGGYFNVAQAIITGFPL